MSENANTFYLMSSITSDAISMGSKPTYDKYQCGFFRVCRYFHLRIWLTTWIFSIRIQISIKWKVWWSNGVCGQAAERAVRAPTPCLGCASCPGSPAGSSHSASTAPWRLCTTRLRTYTTLYVTNQCNTSSATNNIIFTSIAVLFIFLSFLRSNHPS